MKSKLLIATFVAAAGLFTVPAHAESFDGPYVGVQGGFNRAEVADRIDQAGAIEQRSEALHIVRLSRCQHEAERETSGIAPGVELGGEAAARSTKRLGLLSPLFMPTAQ